MEEISTATPDPAAPAPSETVEVISMASEDATKETPESIEQRRIDSLDLERRETEARIFGTSAPSGVQKKEK